MNGGPLGAGLVGGAGLRPPGVLGRRCSVLARRLVGNMVTSALGLELLGLGAVGRLGWGG